MSYTHCQIALGNTYKVTAVATQGGDGLSEWVTSYKLQYTADASTWQYYGKVSDWFGLLMSAVKFKRKNANFHRSAL